MVRHFQEHSVSPVIFYSLCTGGHEAFNPRKSFFTLYVQNSKGKAQLFFPHVFSHGLQQMELSVRDICKVITGSLI